MKSTGWSPKWTSSDDYQIKINLQVNAKYQGLLGARYTLYSMREHCMKAQESAGALELGTYNDFRKAYMLDVHTWTWRNYHDAIDLYNQWSPKATSDAGSGISHRCQDMSGCSTTLMITTMTYTKIFNLWKWLSLEHGLGSRDMEMRSLLDVVLCLSSLLLFCGSQARTNSVSMGFYHLLMDVEFPHALDLLTGRHWTLPIGSWSYDFVLVHMQQECIILSSLSSPFLLYSLCSPGGLHLRRGIM